MTLFEQPSRRPGPAADGPFAALARARRRRRRWKIGIAVAAVLLVARGIFFATGADSVVIAWVQDQTGPRTLPADVAAIADHAFLTDEGRDLLTRVGVNSAHGEALQRACGAADAADDHAVAGCYSLAGIVVFIPSDARVTDAAVTTLAHELLHAAFDRLGSGEVWHVREMLHAALDRVPADDPVRQQIEWSVGGHEENRDTELFAYLGSQVWPDGGFDPELEAVYARYFTDRAALVEVHRRVDGAVDGLVTEYENAVTSLGQAQADAATARARLESDRAVYEDDRRDYQQDADRYNALDAVERARWTQEWWGPDGIHHIGPWQDALAARWADLDARRADLDARAAAVEAADADTVARRAALDTQYADVLAVTEALDPAASGR